MSAAQALPGAVAQPRSRSASMKRWLAILLLPASIIPLPFLGATLLRAPHRLYQQTYGDIHRLIWPLGQRHGPLPPILAPIDGPRESPADRRGATATLPRERKSR